MSTTLAAGARPNEGAQTIRYLGIQCSASAHREDAQQHVVLHHIPVRATLQSLMSQLKEGCMTSAPRVGSMAAQTQRQQGARTPHALMFLKFFFRSQPFTRMLPCSLPPDRRPANAFTNDVFPEPANHRSQCDARGQVTDSTRGWHAGWLPSAAL